ARTLTAVRQVDADFARHCREFGRRVGHGAELSLGWGIVRGRVIAAGDDLAGHNVNKAARLCNEARPYGVIIDRDDFPICLATPRGSWSRSASSAAWARPACG